MEGMSINDLPTEILVRILTFLSPRERLKSTLICRRFAEAFNASYLNDVWLRVRGDSTDEAEAVISNSTRQYKNVRVSKAYPLEFNSVIWTKLGTSLRKLELINAWPSSSGVIYSILLACPSLESLVIADRKNEFNMQLPEPPSGMNLQDIQEATRNLSNLHLGFLVDADTLKNLLVSMPNVSTLFVKRFEPESGFLDCSPDILANLRHLDVGVMETIGDFLLRDILRKTSQLEVLKLCKRGNPDGKIQSSHEALMPILELTKLRELHLDFTLTTRSDSSVSNDFVRDLGRLLSLEYLHLSNGIGVKDHTSFQNLASLPNLRDLTLQNLLWDANCLRAFVLNFEYLRRLRIFSFSPAGEVLALPQDPRLERKTIDSAILSRSDRRGEGIKSSCLETLQMSVIPLSDVGLTCIAAHHKMLKVLEFFYCENITDAGLVNLLQQEPLLEELMVWRCESTDGSFLEPLKELCPRLRDLMIMECDFSCSVVESFKLRRPRVSVSFM